MGFQDFNTFSYLKGYERLFRKIAYFMYVAKQHNVLSKTAKKRV